MKHLNKILVLIAMSVLFYYSPVKAQENNGTLLDSLSDEEDLLDSNLVYKTMHDSLSDKGNWIKIVKSEFIKDVNGNETDLDETVYDDNQYLYVWRPFSVDISWSPYDNGYWLYTEAGWMWMTYYSWGWSTYHYGRWWFAPLYGWVWLPGYVWSANWCYWREYGNYYGWYPYGPRIHWHGHHGYTHHNHHIRTHHSRWVFVKKKDFNGKITKTNIVKGTDLKEIVKNSKRINDVKLADNGSKYIGPEVSTISELTGKKINPVTMNEARTISKKEGAKEKINNGQKQKGNNEYYGSKSNQNTGTSSEKYSNKKKETSSSNNETSKSGNYNNGSRESNSNNSSRESNKNSNSNNSGRESNRNSNSNNSGRESNRNSSPKHRLNEMIETPKNDLKINSNNVVIPKTVVNNTPSIVKDNTVKISNSAPKTESKPVQRETKTEVKKENNTVTKNSNSTSRK